MQGRLAWILFGVGVALLVVLTMTGMLLVGGSLTGYHFPGSGSQSPRPTPIVIPTPVVAPSPVVISTPSPNPYARSFRELPIPKPGGTPYAIIIGPDGAVWFTEAECTSGIGRLAPSGSWQHWPIGSNCGAQPLAITKGADGNLWFADVGDAYGRITMDGTITRFRLPTPGYPSGITTGPDRNLWLAASSPYGKPFIAKISTDGTELAEYPLPAYEQPRGIVTGPDGAIWFTENLGIGRMTTSGKLTEFHLPDGNGAGMPYQIAVGPDRNIWFAEYMPQGDGRVGRLTMSGAMTEFATPGLGGLQWITAGPDNGLWFTAAHTDNIGRISLAGSVTAYPVPSLRAQPVGIMTGPDGNIWFTEDPGDGTGKLGIFTLSRV